MTIGDHIAEILRQGIWASLTGGWCYEPSNTIFCNTLHLYIWYFFVEKDFANSSFQASPTDSAIGFGYFCVWELQLCPVGQLLGVHRRAVFLAKVDRLLSA